MSSFNFIASQTDYVAFKTEVSFEACETQQCVTVDIVNDSISEGSEMLYINLTTNLARKINAAEVVITDNGKKHLLLITLVHMPKRLYTV